VRTRAALGCLLLTALSLSACVASMPPIPLDGRTVEPEPGERALWAEAAREADALGRRVRRYEDPALAAYVLELAAGHDRLAGGPELRVEIVSDPTLNAFALPDGRLIVHTGLLAALESPDAVALVLGREIAHVTHRHALAEEPASAPAPPEGAALGPVAAAILGLRLPLASTAAITGYAAAREREADGVALERLRAAGWDAAGAVAAYAALARAAGEREAFETFLLGRPAWLREREASLRQRLSEAPATPATRGPEDFHARLLPVVRDNAAEDLRLGRFALARRALDRVLAATPDDAVAHVHYGDLHRLQAQRTASAAVRQAQGELARARYARAVELDPALAAPHRQLGLLHYERRELAEARAELERYLALAPAAPDAARVAEYVQELAR
jgi:predicted Zn-dependent protease